jgi:phospholipase C
MLVRRIFIPRVLLSLLVLYGLCNPLARSEAQLGTTMGQPAQANRHKTAFVLPSGTQAIRYVVVIMQENRSTDNLFHGLPNADIATSGLNSKGKKITLTPIGLVDDYDPIHEHADFVAMYDGGKMDGADLVRVNCGKVKHCPPPNAQFKYVKPTEVAPYFQMAETYAFADRMFQTNQGPSFAAHQIIISGTSAPAATSLLFASETPVPGAAGCDVAPTVHVPMIDPVGRENLVHYPCFEHETMPDLLDNAEISWRYYAESAHSLWAGPNSIYHLREGPDWDKDVVLDPHQVLSDISKGNLATVTWITPTHPDSDHPATNKGTGPSWIASIVNAIGNSQYWASTAIFITWDDWGGWYDHVAPEVINSYEYGFRVPLVVVSPYAKPGYVSHVTHDFSSILKFIEGVYGLPSLGYADARADDLSDFFNFSQKPLTFHRIPAPHDANYFLNQRKPTVPADVDQGEWDE